MTRSSDEREIARRAAQSMVYFPHDSSAASDIKCQRLILRLGFEGYGRWWRLCEHMAAINGHRVPFETEEDAMILGQLLGFGSGTFDGLVAAEGCRSFVDVLVDVGLVTVDSDGRLCNSRMDNNALYFGKKRYSGSKGGGSKRATVESKATGSRA